MGDGVRAGVRPGVPWVARFRRDPDDIYLEWAQRPHASRLLPAQLPADLRAHLCVADDDGRTDLALTWFDTVHADEDVLGVDRISHNTLIIGFMFQGALE